MTTWDVSGLLSLPRAFHPILVLRPQDVAMKTGIRTPRFCPHQYTRTKMAKTAYMRAVVFVTEDTPKGTIVVLKSIAATPGADR